MESCDVGALSRRLAATEESLARAHAEIVRLRATHGRSRCLEMLVHVAAVAAVACTILVARGRVARAQGDTFTAPFVVVNRKGQKLLEVKESTQSTQNQILLYNREGQIVAGLIAAENQSGALVLQDSGGQRRVLAGIEDNGDGSFGVWNADGQRIADIVRGPSGNQGLGVYSPDGTPRALLMGTKTGTAQLNLLNDAADNVRAALVGNRNTAFLEIRDPAGTPVGWLGHEAAADPARPDARTPARGLQIYNAAGRAVGKLDVDGEGGGFVRVDGAKKGTAAMMVTPSASMLTLADVNGAVTVNLDSKVGLDLFNDKGTTVGEFRVDKLGGSFWLGDNSGTGMVEAGVVGGEVLRGVVRAGPWIGGVLQGQTPGLPFAILGHK